MSKVEVTKLMRTLTVASTIIVNTIPLKAANVDVVRAILSTPCTLMGGVCAFLYTVVIRGQETFLFSEGNKWFVEVKGLSG